MDAQELARTDRQRPVGAERPGKQPRDGLGVEQPIALRQRRIGCEERAHAESIGSPATASVSQAPKATIAPLSD